MGLRDVSSVEEVLQGLSTQNYLADRGLAQQFSFSQAGQTSSFRGRSWSW